MAGVTFYLTRTLGLLITVTLLFGLVVAYLISDIHSGRGGGPALLTAYPDEPDIIKHLATSLRNNRSDSWQPPLSTRGRYVVDKHSVRQKLISINWYGASDQLYVPGGLDVRHRAAIAQIIRKLGFNSVRLPYADEMVTRNALIPPKLLAANPDLIGLRALPIFQTVVEALTDAGIAVIVNNHITRARWCCDGDLCDAQWANDYLGPLCTIRQSEEIWIANWVTVMRPHVTNPLVVGADLRNEVRGPTGKYLWSAWASACENAAARLHALQPEWLMIVEGVQSANDLSGALSRPVQLGIPNKVVYSAHVYGWSGWGALDPYWGRSYKSFAKDMRRNWEYLLNGDIAPVWIGEIGVPHEPNKRDLHYWTNIVRFLHESDADLGYWALNPRKPDGSHESYGLLETDWATPIYDYRLYDIVRLSKGDMA